MRHPSKARRAAALSALAATMLAISASVAWGQSNSEPADEPTEVRVDPAVELPSDFTIGLEASRYITRHFGTVETDSLLRRMNDIGYRVALVSGRPEIIFTFQILDMDEPNAMALPGGWIFVTRGILELDLTDAELAHLLGHEISHVLHRDFSRQGRLDGFLSLLQTAMVVAVSMVGSGSSRSQPVIEQPGSYLDSQTSAEAALTGTAVFGSVFHELLLRGYSRKLEMEADDGGRRLASLAGYPREAGTSLMQKLHDRVYETREFGYWRTHPYWSDRVTVARSVAPGAEHGPSPAEVAAYRLGVQQGLSLAAAAMRDEIYSDFLYGLALHAGASSGSDFSVHSELLRFRFERMQRRDPLLRDYGPLRIEYDSLLAAARGGLSDPGLIEEIASMRDSVESLRQLNLPPYLEAVNGPNPNTRILERFIRNFPEHPRSAEARFRLARAYRLSSRPDRAATRLATLLEGSGELPADGDSTDAMRAAAELSRLIPDVRDLEPLQNLYERLPDLPVREQVKRRLDELAGTITRLDTAGRFVQGHPDASITPKLRERLIEIADLELKKGRLAEGLGDQQEALETYNRIVILAPETPAAEESRRGISRIQALASAGPAR